MQKQLYGIAIFEEDIVLSDFTGGAEKRFIVTPEQLMGFIRTETTFRPFPGLVWIKTSDLGETVLVTFAAGERVILNRQTVGKEQEVVPLKLRLPSVAVRATIDYGKRTISKVDMWGFPGEELTAGCPLYQLPLPNLGGSSLCLGSNTWKVGQDVREAIEQAAFDGTFIHHNGIVGKESLPFPKYVEKYAGDVPLDTLREIGKGASLLGGVR